MGARPVDGPEEACWALGAMSGTSLDGVDAALLLTDGVDIFDFGPSAYRGYTADERVILRRALGKSADQAAAELVEAVHAELLSTMEGAELVGFHGQTVHHDPAEGVTVQLGNGDVLAEFLGLPVVWDFRSSDMAMGGQGAPLAPFYHFACARWIGEMKPVAFLNLGGVGNLTYVDPRHGRPEEEGALMAFDTGPANAPIDDLVARAGLGAYDAGGRLAGAGQVNDAVLERFLEHGYFRRVPPKSLDRNDFPTLLRDVEGMSVEDGAATLTAAAAMSVVLGSGHFPEQPSRVLVTGGGRHNPVMMEMLAAGLGCPVAPVEEAGLDGDMLEAQAFAYLAMRVMRGLPTSAPGTTGVAAPVGGGRVSRPGAVG